VNLSLLGLCRTKLLYPTSFTAPAEPLSATMVQLGPYNWYLSVLQPRLQL
jgi:hypothetical protein